MEKRSSKVEIDGKKMVLMNCIIDVWNMIEKYNVKGWEQISSVEIAVPEDEYNRLKECVGNDRYIRICTRYS